MGVDYWNRGERFFEKWSLPKSPFRDGHSSLKLVFLFGQILVLFLDLAGSLDSFAVLDELELEFEKVREHRSFLDEKSPLVMGSNARLFKNNGRLINSISQIFVILEEN